jgi:hypothetical protein
MSLRTFDALGDDAADPSFSSPLLPRALSQPLSTDHPER